jgi:argininosuccinate lyase
MTYNRDLQEDKEPVFDSVDTIKNSLHVFSVMLPQLRINRDRMAAASTAGFTLATELADYLATRGVPFRDAHGVVGALVRHCLAERRGLDDLTLAELRRFSPRFGADVMQWLSAPAAVRRRRATGGTSPQNVRRELRKQRYQ